MTKADPNFTAFRKKSGGLVTLKLYENFHHILTPILFFSFSICAKAGCSEINQNNDIQLWTSVDVRKNLGEKVVLDLSNEYRFGDNVSKFYFTFLQGFLSFQWTEWLWIEPGYRQTWVKPPGQNKGVLDSYVGMGKQKEPLFINHINSFRLIYEPLLNVMLVYPGKLDLRQRISYL